MLAPVADGIDPGTGVIGYPLSDLQCPTTVDDGNCLPTPYVGWNSYLNDDSNPAWDFGTTAELLGLIIDGVVYRDIDGNGNITASKLAD